MTIVQQSAWNNLANSLRLYTEAKMRFPTLRIEDEEEAIDNVDTAFDSILEKFHTLYDVTKKEKGFEYFKHGETTFVIELRNGRHHRKSELFTSWNKTYTGLLKSKSSAGAVYLLATHNNFQKNTDARFFFAREDFVNWLPQSHLKNPAAVEQLWLNQLNLSTLDNYAKSRRFPTKQVYIDVFPVVLAAIKHVHGWLMNNGFVATGTDGAAFDKHFRIMQANTFRNFEYLDVAL